MDSRATDLRVMVDASILIAGVVWPRFPYEVLRHALKGDFQLILSPYVIAQARRRIGERFPAYLDQFEDFLNLSGFEAVADPSPEQVQAEAGLVRDATDIPVALAAIQAGADYLVSEDKDLTVRDETTARLRSRLTVYTSGAFLREVMGWSSEALEAIRQRRWDDLSPPE